LIAESQRLRERLKPGGVEDLNRQLVILLKIGDIPLRLEIGIFAI